MKLTDEQKQDLIQMLKKSYADYKEWFESDKSKIWREYMSDEEIEKTKTEFESIQNYCERIEKCEDIDIKIDKKFGDTKDAWWGILALIVIGALWSPTKDGDL